MRFLIFLTAASLALTPVTLSAQVERQVKYQKWGMFGGYKEKVAGPNSWRVLAGVNGAAPEGSAWKIALYRAAELARQAGFEYFQVVNQKGSQTYIGLGWGAPTHRGGGDAELEIVAVNDPAPPQTCLAANVKLCVTLNAEETMNRVRPFLRFPTAK